MISSKALEIAKKSVVQNKKKEAEEIFLMVSNYLSDAMHFMDNGDYVNAFGALNYAHGWLDSGARLKVYKVSDDKLFTV